MSIWRRVVTILFAVIIAAACIFATIAALQHLDEFGHPVLIRVLLMILDGTAAVILMGALFGIDITDGGDE